MNEGWRWITSITFYFIQNMTAMWSWVSHKYWWSQTGFTGNQLVLDTSRCLCDHVQDAQIHSFVKQIRSTLHSGAADGSGKWRFWVRPVSGSHCSTCLHRHQIKIIPNQTDAFTDPQTATRSQGWDFHPHVRVSSGVKQCGTLPSHTDLSLFSQSGQI